MLLKLLHSSKVKNALRIAAIFVLLVIIFAPVQNVLSTPVVAIAHAQDTASASFCDIGSAFRFSNCLGGIVYLFTVFWTSGFLYVGDYVLNFSLQLALNGMSYSLDFLSQGWAIVRDIANLAFIFILIYIAYTIIIQAETAGTMKTLAMVVVMALLINFSFFLSRIVIDAGNILAVQFYNAIPIDASEPSPLGGTGGNTYMKDLGSGIMQAVQVQGILGDKSFKAYSDNNGFLTNLGTQILVYTSVGIMFALIAFMFLTVGIKLLIRIITLWFVIISAPLAFAARAMPHKKIQGYYDVWQTHLLESSFYPAVFLFMFFIITLFLNELGSSANGLIPSIFNKLNASANAAGTAQLDVTTIQGLMSIIANVGIRVGLIIVMVYYALKLSDKFSSTGSAAAQNVLGWAGGKAAGVAGWTARNTAGRAANMGAQNARVQAWAASNKLFLGSAFQGGLKKVASSNFDARGVSGLKSVLGKVNVDVGKAGGKGGFAQAVADKAKRVEKQAEGLKAGPTTARDAQEAHEKKYSAENDHTYNDKIEALKELEDYHKREAADAKRTKEQREQSKKDAKTSADERKSMEEFGKRKVGDLERQRLIAFADRQRNRSLENIWLPSRGSRQGAEKVYKMAAGKSAHDDLIAAAERVRKEHAEEEGHDGGHDDKPDDTGGGGSGKGKKTETKGKSDSGHDEKSGSDNGHSPHASANTQTTILKGIGDNIRAIRENTEASIGAGSGISEKDLNRLVNKLADRLSPANDTYGTSFTAGKLNTQTNSNKPPLTQNDNTPKTLPPEKEAA